MPIYYWRLAAGRLAAMQIGDVVIFEGRDHYIRGLDPESVEPRYAYLEDVRTGKTIQVAFEDVRRKIRRARGGLRLVDDDV